MVLLFELISNSSKKYYVIRKISDKILDEKIHLKEIKENGPKKYCYRWNDNWNAEIQVKFITSKEAKKLRNIEETIPGYDWMINSIINNGTIKP